MELIMDLIKIMPISPNILKCIYTMSMDYIPLNFSLMFTRSNSKRELSFSLKAPIHHQENMLLRLLLKYGDPGKVWKMLLVKYWIYKCSVLLALVLMCVVHMAPLMKNYVQDGYKALLSSQFREIIIMNLIPLVMVKVAKPTLKQAHPISLISQDKNLMSWLSRLFNSDFL